MLQHVRHTHYVLLRDLGQKRVKAVTALLAEQTLNLNTDYAHVDDIIPTLEPDQNKTSHVIPPVLKPQPEIA